MNRIRKTAAELVRHIDRALRELYETKPNEFEKGQIYAYVECLEVLQLNRGIRASLLDYDIEEKYPLP